MLKIISLRDIFAHTAKSDIKCFKVLERKGDPKIAYSPYQDHPYTIKQEEVAILQRKFLSREIKHGIHAFLNLSDAQILTKELILDRRRRDTLRKVLPKYSYSDYTWNWLLGRYKNQAESVWAETPARNFDIFECVVPQGAKYYKGVWENKYPDKLIPNIAATRLTVLRGINDEEVVSPEQEVEPTVDLTVEERLASIAASVASIPESGKMMYTSTTTTITTK